MLPYPHFLMVWTEDKEREGNVIRIADGTVTFYLGIAIKILRHSPSLYLTFSANKEYIALQVVNYLRSVAVFEVRNARQTIKTDGSDLQCKKCGQIYGHKNETPFANLLPEWKCACGASKTSYAKRKLTIFSIKLEKHSWLKGLQE